MGRRPHQFEPLQARGNGFEQIRGLDRLDQKIIGAQAHGFAEIGVGRVGRQKYHGNAGSVRLCAQGREHAESIEPRHLKIAQDQIGRVGKRAAQGLQAINAFLDVVARTGHVQTAPLQFGGVVVNDENAWHVR